MKRIGIVGHNTKLGRLLWNLPNFDSVDETVSNGMKPDCDILVNCDTIQDIPDWGKKYSDAIAKNVRGLHNLHKLFGTDILTISSTLVTKANTPFKMTMMAAEAISQVHGGKVVRVPVCETNEEYEYIADCLANKLENYDKLPRVSTCRLKSLLAKLLGG